MQIYLYKNDKEVGPYSEEQIRAMVDTGDITKTEDAWYEGLPEWQPLNKLVKFDLNRKFPPPPKQTTSKPPETKSRSGILTFLVIIGIIFGTWYFLKGGLQIPTAVKTVLSDT